MLLLRFILLKNSIPLRKNVIARFTDSCGWELQRISQAGLHHWALRTASLWGTAAPYGNIYM